MVASGHEEDLQALGPRLTRLASRARRRCRRCLAPLAAALLAGCAAAALAPPPGRLTPTTCEKRALMTGRAPDLASVEAVAHDMYWGLLAPESCPDAGGRLDGGLIAR